MFVLFIIFGAPCIHKELLENYHNANLLPNDLNNAN